MSVNYRSSVCENVNGLNIHFLEAGFEDPNNPLVVLLHGFPELAFSWRYIIPSLAKQGFHVIAPDQRGFGKTTGWDNSYTNDLSSYHHTNLTKDIFDLVTALGYKNVECIIGHDAGAAVAAWSSLIYPNMYKSVIMMSAPFTGSLKIPIISNMSSEKNSSAIAKDLANLNRPRKHYQDYYRTIEANDDLMKSDMGLRSFIRTYYYYKSADWAQNNPFKLESWIASELEKMPTYYIMDLNEDMPETVSKVMPPNSYINSCEWLNEEDLTVYEIEYNRTGFQGGLNWYRAAVTSGNKKELNPYSGSKIHIPALFIAGKQDWGPYQIPGALGAMQCEIADQKIPTEFIDHAGHWVQQENPSEVLRIIIKFLSNN
ncbi:MAG: alpha/beta hydrolase [SAR202 cluster bacterium]|nr:alpha/beta hydrolase [SAR202 cluster bacterium]|tara:strand:- start:1708 stop:2820 length:1113 start_codon:yes stop_codon:yes gene_type:complete